MFGKQVVICLLMIGTLSTVGCGKKEEPPAKPNGNGSAPAANAPKSLAEAVEKLAKHRDELAAGYESGVAKAADKPWHAMYRIAPKVKDLAAAAELDRYDQRTAEEAAEQLVEILKLLHPPHGADAKVDPADYEKESDSINDAITNLETLAAKTSSAE